MIMTISVILIKYVSLFIMIKTECKKINKKYAFNKKNERYPLYKLQQNDAQRPVMHDSCRCKGTGEAYIYDFRSLFKYAYVQT